MPKSNDNKSWPYQEFHNAHKSINESNFIWESRSYRYNNSGEIEGIYYQWGAGVANSPGSLLYQASYTGAKQNGNILSFRN